MSEKSLFLFEELFSAKDYDLEKGCKGHEYVNIINGENAKRTFDKTLKSYSITINHNAQLKQAKVIIDLEKSQEAFQSYYNMPNQQQDQTDNNFQQQIFVAVQAFFIKTNIDIAVEVVSMSKPENSYTMHIKVQPTCVEQKVTAETILLPSYQVVKGKWINLFFNLNSFIVDQCVIIKRVKKITINQNCSLRSIVLASCNENKQSFRKISVESLVSQIPCLQQSLNLQILSYCLGLGQQKESTDQQIMLSQNHEGQYDCEKMETGEDQLTQHNLKKQLQSIDQQQQIILPTHPSVAAITNQIQGGINQIDNQQNLCIDSITSRFIVNSNVQLSNTPMNAKLNSASCEADSQILSRRFYRNLETAGSCQGKDSKQKNVYIQYIQQRIKNRQDSPPPPLLKDQNQGSLNNSNSNQVSFTNDFLLPTAQECCSNCESKGNTKKKLIKCIMYCRSSTVDHNGSLNNSSNLLLQRQFKSRESSYQGKKVQKQNNKIPGQDEEDVQKREGESLSQEHNPQNRDYYARVRTNNKQKLFKNNNKILIKNSTNSVNGGNICSIKSMSPVSRYQKGQNGNNGSSSFQIGRAEPSNSNNYICEGNPNSYITKNRQTISGVTTAGLKTCNNNTNSNNAVHSQDVTSSNVTGPRKSMGNNTIVGYRKIKISGNANCKIPYLNQVLVVPFTRQGKENQSLSYIQLNKQQQQSQPEQGIQIQKCQQLPNSEQNNPQPQQSRESLRSPRNNNLRTSRQAFAQPIEGSKKKSATSQQLTRPLKQLLAVHQQQINNNRLQLMTPKEFQQMVLKSDDQKGKKLPDVPPVSIKMLISSMQTQESEQQQQQLDYITKIQKFSSSFNDPRICYSPWQLTSFCVNSNVQQQQTTTTTNNSIGSFPDQQKHFQQANAKQNCSSLLDTKLAPANSSLCMSKIIGMQHQSKTLQQSEEFAANNNQQVNSNTNDMNYKISIQKATQWQTLSGVSNQLEMNRSMKYLNRVEEEEIEEKIEIENNKSMSLQERSRSFSHQFSDSNNKNLGGRNRVAKKKHATAKELEDKHADSQQSDETLAVSLMVEEAMTQDQKKNATSKEEQALREAERELAQIKAEGLLLAQSERQQVVQLQLQQIQIERHSQNSFQEESEQQLHAAKVK